MQNTILKHYCHSTINGYRNYHSVDISLSYSQRDKEIRLIYLIDS